MTTQMCDICLTKELTQTHWYQGHPLRLCDTCYEHEVARSHAYGPDPRSSPPAPVEPDEPSL